MSNKSDDKKNVVVVGGGVAGNNIARALSAKLDPSKYNLILITSRPFAIHIIAGARITVSSEDHLENTAFIPYDNLFVNGNGSLIVGTVVSINKLEGTQGGAVTLKDGKQVPFEVLALAPGSSWNGPLAFPDEKNLITDFLEHWRSKYEKAKDIVLIGGGAVGIETAGEIKDQWPSKKVTIVQSDSLLLNKTYPAKFRKMLGQDLKARGIDIVYNDFVDEIPLEPAASVTTRNGEKMQADLIVPTYGPRPNTAFISSLGSDTLTERGFVKVQPTLQLRSHPEIYAAGDVIDWAEQKQAVKSVAHAAVVVANIVSHLAGRTPTVVYKGSTELILITNGKAGGAAYLDVLWGITLGAWFARLSKSKDLLIPKMRESMGAV